MDTTLKIEDDIIAQLNVNKKPLYIRLLWKNDDSDLFHIKVFYDDSSWTGKYSNTKAAERRKKLDETEAEYNTNVRNSLSANSQDYIYDFTASLDDVNSAIFTWKKKYEGAVIMHGAVPLQRDEVPISKDTLIDILLEKNKDLMSELKLASETNNGLKHDLEQFTQRLKDLTESKITLESNLYGRFIQVLNEKKKRIQLLEEHVTSLKISE